jgi:hypothetical protein
MGICGIERAVYFTEVKKAMSVYRPAWPESVGEAGEANDTRLGMLLE